jgi:DNA repair protein RadD
MNYDDLFASLDEHDMQILLGLGAVRLIRTIDPETASATTLNDLAATMYPPAVMLRDAKKRNLLFESMREEHATRLVSHLGLDTSLNPWVTLRTHRFRPASIDEARLFEFFGRSAPPLDSAGQAPSCEETRVGYGLFRHQRRAAMEALSALRDPPHRTMLHMPTGAGKTRTTMHVIAERLRQREPSLAIWLAYSEELCEQAASEFETAWRHLGNRTVSIYRCWGGRPLSVDGVEDGFMVLGLGKAYARARIDTQLLARLSDRACIVVFDEAHQSVAPSFRFVLEGLVDRHQNTAFLGLSATPGRTWNDPETDAELAALFRRRKVTLKVEGYENPVDYLIQAGYLAKPVFESLRHEGNELTHQDRATLEEHLDIPADLLEKLAADEKRNLVIVDRIEHMAQSYCRILVFAATVEHAYLLSAVLNARGVKSAAITGATERGERTRLIQQFRAEGSEPQVLCNYGVLTTGFDAPRTNAAVIARPTRSLVLYSQMVGRAIRGREAGGNDHALIVTVVDTNLPGFGQPQDAFVNWEDVWQ